MLEAMKLPIRKEDRDGHSPLIFAGGPVATANPEPFADIFDFFIIGDGNTPTLEVVKTIYSNKDLDKTSKLKLLAEIAGVYIPQFFDVTYNEDHTIKSINSLMNNRVTKVTEKSFDKCTYTPILTHNTVFKETFLIEIERGCSEKCFFCLASYLNLPVRYPQKEEIIRTIDYGLQYTRRIGLLGALITEHPDINEIFQYIYYHHQKQPIKLTTSSLRADTLNDEIAMILTKCDQRQITISIEAGSENLRNLINKKLSNDNILKCIEICSKHNINTVKMYAMVGLPGETDQDINEIINLIKEIKALYPRIDLILSINSFIPKAHTPFERVCLIDHMICNNKMKYIRKELLKTAKVRLSSTKWDKIQTIISRGDRKLCNILLKSYFYGGTLGSFNRAFKECSVFAPDQCWYANRERNILEILPWNFIDF